MSIDKTPPWNVIDIATHRAYRHVDQAPLDIIVREVSPDPVPVKLVFNGLYLRELGYDDLSAAPYALLNGVLGDVLLSPSLLGSLSHRTATLAIEQTFDETLLRAVPGRMGHAHFSFALPKETRDASVKTLEGFGSPIITLQISQGMWHELLPMIRLLLTTYNWEDADPQFALQFGLETDEFPPTLPVWPGENGAAHKQRVAFALNPTACRIVPYVGVDPE